MDNNEKKFEAIKLGGLWKNKDKNNSDYLAGALTPFTKIMIYKNSYKKPDSNEPDYNMYLVQNEPQKEKPATKVESKDF